MSFIGGLRGAAGWVGGEVEPRVRGEVAQWHLDS